MKAAILVAGYLRTFRTNLPRFIDIMKVHYEKVDIFIHVTSHESEEDLYLNPSTFDEDLKYIVEKFSPISMIVEENIADFGRGRIASTLNSWLKYYKLNQLKCANEYATGRFYDLVFKYRADMSISSGDFFPSEIPDCILLPKESLIDKDKLRNSTDPYLCDVFALGSSELMNRYFDIFLRLRDLCEKHGPVSETNLYWHLNSNDIKYRELNINYSVILSKCNVFAICGDSGSGKSTLAKRLTEFFSNSFVLEGDRYHKWERNDENWKSWTHLNPSSNYIAKMNQDIFDLKLGKQVYQVDYDHKTGKFTEPSTIKHSDNLIVCGLHSLYTTRSDLYDLRIYMDTHEDLKALWKIKRDVNERGHTRERVIEQIQARKADYQEYIANQREEADVIISFYPRTLGKNDDVSLKILVKTFHPVKHVLDKFTEFNLPLEIIETTGYFILDFERYCPVNLWGDNGVPQFSDFYDYIIFVIVRLRRQQNDV